MFHLVQTFEGNGISRLGAGAAVFCGFLLIGCADSRSAPRAQAATPAAVEVAAEPAAPAAAVTTPVVVEVTPSDRVAPKRTRKALSPEVERALATVDPTRVFKTAQPGPEVPLLQVVGASEQRIQPGETATLAVAAAPDALVTFWSKDGGLFANDQASITVLADDEGVARATLTANQGTIDDVPVLIGSPQATGTISLLVHVLYPSSPFVTATAQPE